MVCGMEIGYWKVEKINAKNGDWIRESGKDKWKEWINGMESGLRKVGYGVEIGNGIRENGDW